MESLASLIAREGPMSVRAAVGWTARLAMTLEALHRDGAVHGVVGPANIWVASGDSDGAVGILVHPIDSIRDPGYERPERVEGFPSPFDDCWAAAAVLYFLLTGTSPFKETMVGTWHKPKPIALFGANHEVLQITLDRCWQQEAELRIDDVRELRGSLAALDPGSIHLIPLQLALPGALPGDPGAKARSVAAVLPAVPPKLLFVALGGLFLALFALAVYLLR